MPRSTTMNAGVSIIPGSGSVVRNGPLTLVLAGRSDVGAAALTILDDLASTEAWGFDQVSAALHQIVVDNDPSGVAAVLQLEGEAILFAFDRAEATAGDTAVKAVQDHSYDAVLMDVRMARMSGREAFEQMRAINPALPVIIMTAYASVGTAVDALKSGASDY